MSSRWCRCRARTGFAVVQLLVVIAIAGLVAALAIPVYADKARTSVERQNVRSMALLVKSVLVDQPDPTFAAESAENMGTDGAQRSVSLELAQTLRQMVASRAFVNLHSGSRTVVCQSGLPSAADSGQPAVWITDDASYADEAYRPSAQTENRLAGTLLVVFSRQGSDSGVIDVFAVDDAGRRSAATETIVF